MTQYDRSDAHDLLLVQWWAEMFRTGAINVVFGERHRTLGGMMSLFQNTATLWFETDAEGIAVALWGIPFFAGANVSLWTAPRIRRTRAAYGTVEMLYRQALTEWPVLVGFIHESLLDIHRKLGYTVIGDVSIIVGAPAWCVALTKEGFAQREVILDA